MFGCNAYGCLSSEVAVLSLGPAADAPSLFRPDATQGPEPAAEPGATDPPPEVSGVEVDLINTTAAPPPPPPSFFVLPD